MTLLSLSTIICYWLRSWEGDLGHDVGKLWRLSVGFMTWVTCGMNCLASESAYTVMMVTVITCSDVWYATLTGSVSRVHVGYIQFWPSALYDCWKSCRGYNAVSSKSSRSDRLQACWCQWYIIAMCTLPIDYILLMYCHILYNDLPVRVWSSFLSVVTWLQWIVKYWPKAL